MMQGQISELLALEQGDQRPDCRVDTAGCVLAACSCRATRRLRELKNLGKVPPARSRPASYSTARAQTTPPTPPPPGWVQGGIGSHVTRRVLFLISSQALNTYGNKFKTGLLTYTAGSPPPARHGNAAEGQISS